MNLKIYCERISLRYCCGVYRITEYEEIIYEEEEEEDEFGGEDTVVGRRTVISTKKGGRTGRGKRGAAMFTQSGTSQNYTHSLGDPPAYGGISSIASRVEVSTLKIAKKICGECGENM